LVQRICTGTLYKSAPVGFIIQIFLLNLCFVS
jgi:hypothetical protein